MNLQRFLNRYYAYLFLFDAMLCYAVYTALFELRGLSFTQIGALLAFWSLSAIVLELPSGALSDRFDRRWLLVAAPLAKLNSLSILQLQKKIRRTSTIAR